MTLAYATDEDPEEKRARRVAAETLARVELVRAALGAVLASPSLTKDHRTGAPLSQLEDATRVLLLLHCPNLCPPLSEGT